VNREAGTGLETTGVSLAVCLNRMKISAREKRAAKTA